MGVRILVGKADGALCDNAAILYDSVSGWAFGPLFDDFEQADHFANWLPVDARAYTDIRLAEMYSRWRESSAFDGEGEFVGTPEHK